MQRSIVGFHEDEDGWQVADLSCGHTQHVRHNPPWEVRPWAAMDQGRRDHLGAVLDCVECDEQPNTGGRK